MRITAILLSKRSSERVTVKFDDDSTIILPLEVVIAARLRRGQEIEAGALETLQSEGDRWRCREAALRLVGFRARSRKELHRRLLQRGFPAAAVERCIVDLQSAGLLDDRAFADAFASDRLRSRPVGRTRLVYELRAKGVDEDTARLAAEQAFAAADSELDLARRAARRFRKQRGEDGLRAKRRLLGMLSRRGFSRETIRTIVEELLG